MKTTNLCIFAFIILSLTNSCSKVEEQENDRIIIAGKINGYNSDSDDKLVEIIFNDILEGQKVEISQINENGEFKHITDRPYPQDFMFYYGTLVSLFVAPGDSIYLDVDSSFSHSRELNLNRYDLIKVAGTASKMNEDMIAYNKFYSDSLYDYSSEDKILRESTPGQYKEYIDKRTVEYLKRTEIFNLRQKTCKEFREWVYLKIEYDALDDLMRYRWMHPMRNRINRDSFSLSIPHDYFSFLNESATENRDAVVTTSYYSFINEFGMYLFDDSFPKDSTEIRTELSRKGDKAGLYKMVIRHVMSNTPQFSQDMILSNLYYTILKQGELDVYEEVSPSAPIKEKALNDILQSKYRKSKVIAENPHFSDNTSLSKIPEEIIQPILDSILIKHKNNVVYIDFWAPWCGPCMMEMPYSQKVREKYEGKNVRFVYLANRCTEQSWKITIAEEQIQGNHYLLTDDQFKVLAERFRFTGIPHYLLIDKNGNVVDGDAPRPRQEETLIKLIDQLL